MKKSKEKPMTQDAPMYIYATEMVANYYSKLKIKNKKVLAVCGSGDQVLDAYFFGAKSVIGFDLNKRSEFITRLKIVAIKEFSYKEFLKFFGESKSNASFDYKLYIKIRKSLNSKTCNFFDKLYNIYSFSGKKLVKSDYFRQRNFIINFKLINSYLKNEKNYLKLRKILESVKFEFIRSDIKNISSNRRLIKEKFDIINLSNLPNYFVTGLIKENVKNPIMHFFDKIIIKLRKKLSVKGKIFYYSYSPRVYPNEIAKEMPFISRNYPTVKKIASEKGFKVYTKDLKRLKKGIRDKITILEKN